MRNAFVNSLIELYKKEPFIFLTGDLGFNMLEPLRDLIGERFINCGISEQNMVSMAAGMAKTGESVWVYSIAPFLYARAFEQIRNDVCFHNLNVKLVGMGGGYHYGDLGPSHWALEDYGTLLTLPNMKCYIPAFADDIAPIIQRMDARKGPSWLRLGRCEKPKGFTVGTWDALDAARHIRPGAGKTIMCVGPIVSSMIKKLPQSIDIWVRNTIDSEYFPCSMHLPHLVVEEHVPQGSLGQIWQCKGLYARHFTSGPYGDQNYMRKRAGLTPERVLGELNV